MGKDRFKRANGAKHWVQLEHYLLECAAWKALTPNARIVYIEIKKRYNGRNNGMLALSSRDAGDAINASHNTGARALRELVEAGFLVICTGSSFNRKVRLATEYRITEARDDRDGFDPLPTKDFMKSKHSGMGDTKR
jgi:hypothetical protein